MVSELRMMQQTALEERRQNGPQGGECEDDATNGSRGEEAERPSRRGVRNGLSWRGGHSRGEEYDDNVSGHSRGEGSSSAGTETGTETKHLTER